MTIIPIYRQCHEGQVSPLLSLPTSTVNVGSLHPSRSALVCSYNLLFLPLVPLSTTTPRSSGSRPCFPDFRPVGLATSLAVQTLAPSASQPRFAVQTLSPLRLATSLPRFARRSARPRTQLLQELYPPLSSKPVRSPSS